MRASTRPRSPSWVLAGGDKSEVQVLQRIGRGMRKPQGRTTDLQVIDFLDLTNEGLARHSRERMKMAASVGYRIEDG